MRTMREPVVTTRAVRVECVPDGRPADLPPGTPAHVTQALGGSFTLWVEGQLMRLRGADADAIGKPVPTAPAAAAQSADIGVDELTGLVWQTLKTCYDPEIPVDIVELGLVYVCDVLPMDDGKYRVSVKSAASDIIERSHGGSNTRATVASPTRGKASTLSQTSSAMTSPMPQPGAVRVILIDTRNRPSSMGSTSQT